MTSPDPALDAQPDTDVDQPGAGEVGAEPEPVPNRAARRAKQVKQAVPSHVGPQGGFGVQRGRGPRSHSKRAR